MEGERVALGSPGFVADQLGLALPPEIAALAARERTMVVLAGESGVRGAILLDDSLRPESPALVAELRRAGKRVLLLSGDEPGAVRRIAAAAGIDEWEGGASPERKVERVRELTASGAVVAMVGDGVNDAAALAAAPVSVAMGSGAFLAAATADAVLLSNRPQDLGFAVRHAARAIRRVKQNFALAFGYNLIVIPLAAMGRIPPWAAAIGMSASSAMVVLNALRLRDVARGGRLMESVFLLVPLAAVLALGTVAALFWAVRSGQFEDLEGPAHRILMDDDAPPSVQRTDEKPEP